MRDVAFLSLVTAIFALGVAYVSACGRILGPEGLVEAETDTPEGPEARR
jgi:hypothetical protein